MITRFCSDLLAHLYYFFSLPQTVLLDSEVDLLLFLPEGVHEICFKCLYFPVDLLDLHLQALRLCYFYVENGIDVVLAAFD